MVRTKNAKKNFLEKLLFRQKTDHYELQPIMNLFKVVTAINDKILSRDRQNNRKEHLKWKLKIYKRLVKQMVSK